jgi:hypothetical protein
MNIHINEAVGGSVTYGDLLKPKAITVKDT